MCGISFLITETPPNGEGFNAIMNFQHRGPDYTNIMTMKLGDSGFYMTMVFHRLSIVDKSVNGVQPFIVKTSDDDEIFCVCNGEIYNHNEIRQILFENNYKHKYKSKSDCEVLPYLYEYCSNEEKFLNLIKDNEFAFVIVKHNKYINTFDIFIARDPYGVRPLYRAHSIKKGFICISSELKGIPNLDDVDYCEQFSPMSYLKFKINGNNKNVSLKQFVEDMNEVMYLTPLEKFKCDNKNKDEIKIKSISIDDYTEVLDNIRKTLEKSVNDRLMSDRPLGALLSGGLDSSLVCAIASRTLELKGEKLRTFSVGMPGSTDEYYAKKVAEYIGSDHTHFSLSKDEFQSVCEETIWKVESYDCTTVRASVCQLLCAKYVAKTTDIKVLLVGDGSDELFGGYVYFKNSPSSFEFHNECVRLVENIHLFDGQRSDRLIASYGMETRSPFQQDTFVRTVLSSDPNIRVPLDTSLKIKRGPIEKCLLRLAFIGYLPSDCLWRTKEAFSDGVSGKDDSWYLTAKLKAEKMYNDEEFQEKIKNYQHMMPTSKEELYYREVFGKVFSENVSKVIPYRWMPKAEWVGNVSDPSARVLDVYNE